MKNIISKKDLTEQNSNSPLNQDDSGNENYSDGLTKKVKKEQLEYCKSKITAFYDRYVIFYNKYEKYENPPASSIDKNLPDNINDLSDDVFNDLQKQKTIVTNCVEKYSRNLDRETKKIAKWLTNLNNLEEYFQINATIAESKDIYNKTNSMGISNTIRKVLNEQSEIKKSSLVEKRIIENRLNFVLDTKTNKKQKLFNEAKELINKGYNKKMVKETVKKYLK